MKDVTKMTVEELREEVWRLRREIRDDDLLRYADELLRALRGIKELRLAILKRSSDRKIRLGQG